MTPEAARAAIEGQNERVHAFLSVAPVTEGRRGALSDLSVALKDNLVTSDLPTTCGSKILQGYQPPYDATTVWRLKAAGADLVGKTNLDEFAMGSSTENSAFGPTRNPWDLTKVPGGSSGGSAAAVAAGMCDVALGSDTGGSVRQPAAYCGVLGLRPTYGRISRYGLVAFASSLDQVGVLAADVKSAARVYETIAGPDPMDATCADLPVEPVTPGLAGAAGAAGLRLGLVKEAFGVGIAPDVAQAVEDEVKALERAGATVSEVHLPHAHLALSTYYLLAMAEASSNLARYDGIRYGRHAEGALADAEIAMAEARGQGFGREVKRRIILGTYVLSAGYYDAYYRKAQRVRTLIAQDFEQALSGVDALVMPTAPDRAFALGERVDDPLRMYAVDFLTVPASLAGLPSLSVPAAVSPGTLPIGLQLVGAAWQEERLFRLAAALEELRPWPKRAPSPEDGRTKGARA